jgi:hypothetical protein
LASEQQPQQWRGDGSDTSSASASSPPSGAFSAAAAAPAAAAADLGALNFDGPDLTLGGGGAAVPPHSQPFPQHDDDDDLFGLRALRQRAVSHGAAESSEAAEAEAGDAAPTGGGEGGEGGEGPQPPSEPAGVGMVRRMSRSVRVSEQHRIQRTHTGLCGVWAYSCSSPFQLPWHGPAGAAMRAYISWRHMGGCVCLVCLIIGVHGGQDSAFSISGNWLFSCPAPRPSPPIPALPRLALPSRLQEN